ncbi:MAG: hypothetical protein ACKOSS_05000 [Planctomycetia bacterium]
MPARPTLPPALLPGLLLVALAGSGWLGWQVFVAGPGGGDAPDGAVAVPGGAGTTGGPVLQHDAAAGARAAARAGAAAEARERAPGQPAPGEQGPPLDDEPDPLAALTPGQRAALCAALLAGDDGTALATCRASSDPALLTDLLATLDRLPVDAQGWPIDAQGRARLVEAIAALPVPSVEARVELLRERQTGLLEHDRPLLAAVARMGGAAAVRLLLEVLGREGDALEAAQRVARELDLSAQGEALAVLQQVLAGGGAAARAAYALAARREVSPALVTALLASEPREEGPAAQRAWLASLALTGDPRALARVVEAARAGEGVAAAQSVLAQHAQGGAAACAVLQQALEQAVEPGLRVALMAARGRTGEPAAEPALLAALAGRDAAERRVAAQGLARLRAPSVAALDALVAAHEGAEPGLQRDLRAALAAHPSEAARARLQRLEAGLPQGR